MTTAAPARTTTRALPLPERRTARLAGAFYLLTFLSSIPAVLLLDPVLSDPRYVLGAGGDARVTLGLCLDLVNAFACVATAVVLFPLLKREHETLALGFVTSRVLEAAIIAIGVVSLLALLTLRSGTEGTADVGDDVLVAVGTALVAVRDWTFLLGPGVMAAVNAALLGTLLYRSGLVPRLIPTIGLVGAPLLLASDVATLFGLHDQLSPTAGLAALPIAAWELSLGCYLVLRGFRRAVRG